MSKKTARAIPSSRTVKKPAVNASYQGYVEVFGYSSTIGGWLFSCWIPAAEMVGSTASVEFLATFEEGQCWGKASIAFFQRDDVSPGSIGVIAFMPSTSHPEGTLQHVAFSLHGIRYQPQCGDFSTRLPDQELVQTVRSNLLTKGYGGGNREQLLALTARAAFTGQDTLQALKEHVLLDIDEAIACPPSGIFLKGWYLSARGAVRHVRVRSGPLAAEICWNDVVRMDRPDVIRAVGPQSGFLDARSGFMVFLPDALSAGHPAYLEVELASGEMGFRNLKVSKSTGIDAIRRILSEVDVRFGEIDFSFDRTFGPAVASINVARRAVPAAITEISFGDPPARPVHSVIVPLYGRVDYLEFQMAMFSAQWEAKLTEILYVLDDPSKRQELEVLAHSVHERFRIPFRLLILDQNIGYAGANNAGLARARGHYVCFLNSDVFPISPAWLERLSARLKQNSEIGIIGARLLFEDGSVQHEGCYYKPERRYGNWTFVEHLNKGLRPREEEGVRKCAAITGACMVMTRSLAEMLGGFDEAYVIGDFEDSDLCLKAKARGLECAVDMGVEMYHLERQSQSSPAHAWRMNLTLYNAWIHQRRWFGSTDGQAASAGRLK